LDKLVSIIDNRKWVRNDIPFPHVTATNVFTPAFYSGMAREYEEILRGGKTDSTKIIGGKLSKNMAGYDAYGLGFDQNIKGNLAIFASPEWCDLLARLYGVQRTPYINVGIHHHAVGSADGWLHNDLNPTWFAIGEGSVQFPSHAICSYKHGEGPLSADKKIQVVRGVVMIFYLANDGWEPGMGGETGLYSHKKANVNNPVAKVPPINNSLIIYECTPHSYHAFLKNHVQERNSVIMWIHRTMDDTLSRWKEEDMEQWTK
jgi:hypothetical protein